MGGRLRDALLAGVVAAAAGCDPGVATQTLVHVDADDAVAARARTVRVSVWSHNGALVRRQDVAVGGDRPETAFPFVLPLEPESGDASRSWRVRLEARDATSLIVDRLAIGGYRAGTRLHVRVVLESACEAAPACGADETCVAGACASACVEGSTDEPASASPPAVACPAVRPTCLADAIDDVALGGEHGCAVAAGGDLYCYGANDRQQLGIAPEDADAHPTPTRVALAERVANVGAGAQHTCAVTDVGTLQCWGDNRERQIGLNNLATEMQAAPVTIAHRLGGTWRHTVLGAAHTYAVDDESLVWGFGSNAFDQLGSQPNVGRDEVPHRVGCHSDTDCPAPFRIGCPEGCEGRLAAGDEHGCGIDEAGRVLCWGGNASGQLGVTGLIESWLPVDPTGLAGWSHVVAGSRFTCALREGEVHCWGDNSAGQLGRPISTAPEPPARVASLAGVLSIAAGRSHACALTGEGTVVCWGDNALGQLGLGSVGSPVSDPVQVSAPQPLEALAAGGNATCGLTALGTLLCWGSNAKGQLGIGAGHEGPRPEPAPFCLPE